MTSNSLALKYALSGLSLCLGCLTSLSTLNSNISVRCLSGMTLYTTLGTIWGQILNSSSLYYNIGYDIILQCRRYIVISGTISYYNVVDIL